MGRVGAFVLTFALTFAVTAAVACQPDQVQIRGDFGQARFSVEVADEPAERARGLMNRPSMPMSAGMLFVYDGPRRAQFWMKNTLIPLDMIFTDQTGRITHIHENAVPMDETIIDGGFGVFTVLEINGGLAGELGLSVGDELRHPAIPASRAVWPCPE
ncbi:MAG: DUF192 domain-containing protein [Pseudomonadota bacterium]